METTASNIGGQGRNLIPNQEMIDHLQATLTAERRTIDSQRGQIDLLHSRVHELESLVKDRETRLATAAQMDADLRSGLLRIARRASDLNRPDVWQSVGEVLGLSTHELQELIQKG